MSRPSVPTSDENHHRFMTFDGPLQHVSPPTVGPVSFPESQRFTKRLRAISRSSAGRRGRSRYFGITTNYHIFSEEQCSRVEANSDTQNRRAQAFLATIPRETNDLLLNMFWTCHNACIAVVHREAWEMDYMSGGDMYYSGFLHVCMLAIGFRYNDKSQNKFPRLASSSRVSLLHHEAKRLVEYELNGPGGVPSIQALLLLADLECGVGNNNTGWLYAGMATRLCFDLGLNRDSLHVEIPDLEYQVRRTILWGAVILDRYWALFLGRPVAMKLTDLRISHKDQPMYGCSPMGPDHTLETEIYESLIGLMDIASRLTESEHCEYSSSSCSAYYFAAGLDNELQEWDRNLSRRLSWDPEKLETAPAGYFILHQQYHTLFILLYRPFIPDGSEFTVTNDHEGSSVIQQIARRTCFIHAVEIAKLFAVYSRRFNLREQLVTGTQHAATAALALVESIPTVAPRDRADALVHLQCLAEALSAKASSYFPAKAMSELIFTVIGGYRANRGPNPSAVGENMKKGLDPAFVATEPQNDSYGSSHNRFEGNGVDGDRGASRAFAMETFGADGTGRRWVEGQTPIHPALQHGFDSEWQGIMDILSAGSITDY